MSSGYSFITSIEVTNFMSIEHGYMEFDESNIIAVCGLNDSGKSAITSRALSILFYDAFSRDQVKFIKEGKEYFCIKMSFDDNVSVSKTKFLSGASVWEMRQGTQLLYTNKLETGVQAVADVPEPIKKYLGVLYDECTDSMLNVRRNTDRLFLIDTTGGDNYKILNTVLRSEVLAKASMAMTQDKNKMNIELQVKVNQYNGFVQQCEAMQVTPEEELDNLAKLSEEVRKWGTRGADIERVCNVNTQIQGITLSEVPDAIECDRYKQLQNLQIWVSQMQKSIMPEISDIDVVGYTMLNSIMGYAGVMQKPIMPELESLNSEQYETLARLTTLWANLQKMQQEFTNTDTSLQECTSELQKLSKEYNFRICKNCGTIVLDDCACEKEGVTVV